MPAQETHYDVLGLDHETCEFVDIKKSFKRLALLHHPDRVPPEKKEEAAEKFRTIREAFEVLSDGPKKLRYDSEMGLKRKKHKAPEPPANEQTPRPRSTRGRSTNRRTPVASESGNYFNKNDIEDQSGFDWDKCSVNDQRQCLVNAGKMGFIVVVIASFTCAFLFT